MKAQFVLGELALELFDGQIGAKAGDRFQLVERAAGMAQSAAGDHRHDHARRRRDRSGDQTGLIADAAGGMLIHLDAGNGRQIHDGRRSAHASVSALTSRSVMPEKKVP